MSVIFIDEEIKKRFEISRTPHEYLDFLFEQTATDGELIIPSYKFDTDEYRWLNGRFEMNWNLEDVSRLHDKFDEYVALIEKTYEEHGDYSSLLNKPGLVAEQTYLILAYMGFDAPKTVIEAEKYFLIQDMAIEKYGVIIESEYCDLGIRDEENFGTLNK